ncbi:MAG: DUF459 domain-containing protein [Rhizobiaceae bacterium]
MTMIAGMAGRAVLQVLVAVSFAVAMLALPPVVHAQERDKPRNLFQFIFGGGKSETRKAAPRANSKVRSKSVRTKARTAEQEVAEVEKVENAKVVLVVGDFMASGLAEGLVEVFAQNPAVQVVARTNGSSGFVRPDFHDWPAEAEALIDELKPAAVIVMIGANDRQQMRIGEVREQSMSEAWLKEYAIRSVAFGEVVRGRNVPLLWVGAPSFKLKRMTSDMLVLNDVYRAAAESVRGEFIDIWDGFVDENGTYVQTGPDINGQPVRLRGGDGINFTRAGKRKLAFYAEKPLAKILGNAATGGSRAAPQFLGAGVTPVDPLTIDRTVPVSLMDPELDGSGELLGLTVEPRKGEARTPGEKLAIEGIAPEASPGRADDFSGRPPVVAEPAGDDTTTSIVAR